MQAIRNFATFIADRPCERYVDRIVRYLAKDIKKNGTHYAIALCSGAIGNLFPQLQSEKLVILPYAVTEIITSFLPVEIRPEQRLGLRGLIGVVASSAYGYFCVEGVKAISSRIFASV